MSKLRYKIISFLLTENEKCILNQGLNDSKEALVKDYKSGLSCTSDFLEDTKLIEDLRVLVKNKLWN